METNINTMKKVTNENKLYYMGAGLSAIACLIALYAIVAMLKDFETYGIVQIVLTFAGLGLFGFLTNYLYRKA